MGAPSTMTGSLDGLLEIMTLALSGRISTASVVFNPEGAVTVSWKMRPVLPVKGCPVLGTVNVPILELSGLPMTCVWLSCFSMMIHWKLLSVSFSSDVALPWKKMTLPLRKSVLALGAVMETTGGLPTLMVRDCERMELPLVSETST